MKAWPKDPVIYEINTWVWLHELSQKYKTPMALAEVPAMAWDAIAAWNVDAVWLMGVWERRPAGIAIANQNQGLVEDFRRALPDYRSEDNVGSPYCVRLHLCADLAYQEKLVRFIENHDEPRALSVFSPQKARAAAVTIATIPGAKLLHEGQCEGRKVRLPVFLGRRPAEPADPDLSGFYQTLLKLTSREALRNGHWQLCERTGWPDNASCQNLIAWCWRSAGEHLLIVVNLSDSGAQGQVRLPWDELAGKSWRMTDLFSGQMYERRGAEMCHPGMYVDLPPWGYHVLTRWLPTG